MRPIQLLMEADVLSDLDAEAERQNTDRSKIIRTAVKQYLAEVGRVAREEAHRHAYEQQPLLVAEMSDWESIQVWPED